MRDARIHEYAIGDWAEFVDIVTSWSGFRNWGFRGQASAKWPLLSSLARHVEFTGVCKDAWPLQEERIRRIFERKAHLFMDDPPRDELEWLALMQHHGAPTRLLDLTWSPFVAAFFALERATDEAAVWAFNLPLIWQEAKQGIDGMRMRDADPRDRSTFNKVYLPNQYAFVWQGDPFRMPQRVIAQSGTFLVSSHLGMTVEQILERYPRKRGTSKAHDETLLVKFVFDTRNMREDAMATLYSMNITQSTLFPDLDGLARSMLYEFEYSWQVDLKTNKPTGTLQDGHLPTHILKEK
ncbi:MAG: FRG domain-containing protein [Xanthomonadales bacterium]|nr:FRG domain-containing protein [Xanthomonadales bacterium]